MRAASAVSASPDATVLLEEGLRVLVHHVLQAKPHIVRQMIRNQADLGTWQATVHGDEVTVSQLHFPHEDLIRPGTLGAKAGVELRSFG